MRHRLLAAIAVALISAGTIVYLNAGDEIAALTMLDGSNHK